MKSSEIIVDAGKIYHLGLRAEQVFDTVITVGDQNRVAMVSKHFDEHFFTVSKREFTSHGGRIGSKKVLVISTGIGTDNIDIVLNELNFLANYDLETGQKVSNRSLLICRLGTSGAIQKDIPIDQILVNSAALGLDNLMHFYAHKEAIPANLSAFIDQLPVKPYYTKASATLLDLFKNYHSGVGLTCPGFYAPQGRQFEGTQFPLLDLLSDNLFTNMEMETAGIYGLAALHGHQAISVNALLANRVTGVFSTNPTRIIEKMIADSLSILF